MFFFIYAFFEYCQIFIFQPDEEKTTFVMPHGLYCYRVMPFGLKNVDATYQWLMTKIFKSLIGRIVKVYIDDIMVKSKTHGEHVQHLEETFGLMMAYNMKLNPSKYTFGVDASKFLGFMVTQRGIKVNSDQIRVIIETFALSNKKELQCLTGRLAALRCFIARFTDKLRSFYLTLKGASAIGWTDKCGREFYEVKSYLTQPLILSSPQSGEQLYMYLAMFDCAISVVLFHYIRDKEQRLVYYVNKAMVDVKTRYSKMEQTNLALKSAAQKLCPYFQAHQVTILTNQPL